jgi:hypothetical protein
MILIATEPMTLISTPVVQGICWALCFVAFAVAVNLMLHREATTGIKVMWIAAVLVALAVAPGKLPFLLRDAGACLFYRNAFGGVFVVLLLLNIFVIFWIELPRERVPRFSGKVTMIVNSQGTDIPRVEFTDKTGQQNVFDDTLATTIFPNHTFAIGEHVVVRAPMNARPHIDRSVLARWNGSILLVLITGLAFVLSLSYHLRFLSILPYK